jgi:hypothetical protein
MYCFVTGYEYEDQENENGWRKIKIGRPWLCDDMDSLYVKIDNLNKSLVRFCFIKSIDKLADRDA